MDSSVGKKKETGDKKRVNNLGKGKKGRGSLLVKQGKKGEKTENLKTKRGASTRLIGRKRDQRTKKLQS